MNPAKPHHVTLAQWLAVLAVWGLATYGVLAGEPVRSATDQAHLIACR